MGQGPSRNNNNNNEKKNKTIHFNYGATRRQSRRNRSGKCCFNGLIYNPALSATASSQSAMNKALIFTVVVPAETRAQLICAPHTEWAAPLQPNSRSGGSRLYWLAAPFNLTLLLSWCFTLPTSVLLKTTPHKGAHLNTLFFFLSGRFSHAVLFYRPACKKRRRKKGFFFFLGGAKRQILEVRSWKRRSKSSKTKVWLVRADWLIRRHNLRQTSGLWTCGANRPLMSQVPHVFSPANIRLCLGSAMFVWNI